VSSIVNNRKKLRYRFFESLLGLTSFGVLITLFLLAFFDPELMSILLIIYSFFMVVKVSLHGVYTIYTYKNLLRWESVDWLDLFQKIKTNSKTAKKTIQTLADNHNSTLDFAGKLKNDLEIFDQLQGTVFENPENILQIPLFSVYNESSEVLIKSLEAIWQSKYPLNKIVVFISQEARAGQKIYDKLYQELAALDWVNPTIFVENDLKKVYEKSHLNFEYKNDLAKNFEIKNNKLNLVFTRHPDGLVGEIKGKASNEDWGARQASLFLKAKKFDPELCIVTSLDADSRIGKNYLQMLSFRYCLTPDRVNAGFQPLPIYTNNYFTSNTFPRLVATSTTIWHMILYSVTDQLHFFANYSVPLKVLQKVDFWEREVIAEDNLLYIRCVTKLAGKFRVVPFYATFEGDSVYGEDYLDAIANQYKQLQRWAWGGIEGIPYKLEHFFVQKEGWKIPLRKRILYTFNEFINHFYWATSPIIFTVLTFFPYLLGGITFRESPSSLNLWFLSQYFAWLSFIFLLISSYISFRYIAKRAMRTYKPKWYEWIPTFVQWLISPMIFFMWGPPAIDVQWRGVWGKYLGYWITPKE